MNIVRIVGILLSLSISSGFSAEIKMTEKFRQSSENLEKQMQYKERQKKKQYVYKVRNMYVEQKDMSKFANLFNVTSTKNLMEDTAVVHIESESKAQKIGFLKKEGTLFYYNHRSRKEPILPADVNHIEASAKAKLEQLLGKNIKNYEVSQVSSRLVKLIDTPKPFVIAKTYKLKRVVDGSAIDGPIGYATLTINKDDEVSFMELNDPELEPQRPVEWKGMDFIQSKLLKQLSEKNKHFDKQKISAKVEIESAKPSYVFDKQRNVLVPAITVTTINTTTDGEATQESVAITYDE